MPWWASLIAAVLTGGLLTGLLTHVRERRAGEQSAFEMLTDVRRRALAAEQRHEDLERERDDLIERLARAPVFDGLSRFFDDLICSTCRKGIPIVATTPENGGTIVYVSPEFCAALGRPETAFLGEAWRDHLHPDDEEKTAETESRAHYEPVVSFGNRFKHADGHWVGCRWDCSVYDRVSLCRVSFSGRRIAPRK